MFSREIEETRIRTPRTTREHGLPRRESGSYKPTALARAHTHTGAARVSAAASLSELTMMMYTHIHIYIHIDLYKKTER